MEEIKLVCGNCGEETTRPPKPAPQNAREGKQPYFHCGYCKAVNLRDGTIRTKKSSKVLEVPEEKKEGSSIGNAILPIVICVLGVVAGIFLRKVIKGQVSGPGNKADSPGQSDKSPWSLIR